MCELYQKFLKNDSTYLIAEIGSNHNGDLDLAKNLILSAKENGADCVKFQSWDDNSLISNEEYNRNQVYGDSPKKHFGSLREMVDKYYLRKEQHYELKEFSDNVGIEFASTPFSNNEVDLLVELNVPFLKVASMDINNLPFLKYLAETQKIIILSTGMARLSEIETAIETIEKTGNTKIVLLHCISVYPPKNKDINLNNIIMLKNTFNYPVGFSDHTIGLPIPFAAISLGSCLIEKHFTLDKELDGWDHEISCNPLELKMLVEGAIQIKSSLGSFRRIVSADENEKKKKFRRSALININLSKGTVLEEKHIGFKRPGTGISPNELKYILGRRINRDFEKDELISWEDLE